MTQTTSTSTLFPYTTLFRSAGDHAQQLRGGVLRLPVGRAGDDQRPPGGQPVIGHGGDRSEEHTSELQSRGHLVCRLLLEKKKRPTTSIKPSGETNTNSNRRKNRHSS